MRKSSIHIEFMDKIPRLRTVFVVKYFLNRKAKLTEFINKPFIVKLDQKKLQLVLQIVLVQADLNLSLPNYYLYDGTSCPRPPSPIPHVSLTN